MKKPPNPSAIQPAPPGQGKGGSQLRRDKADGSGEPGHETSGRTSGRNLTFRGCLQEDGGLWQHLGADLIYPFQIRDTFFPILEPDMLEGITDLTDNTELNSELGKENLNRLGESFQPINTGNEAIFSLRGLSDGSACNQKLGSLVFGDTVEMFNLGRVVISGGFHWQFMVTINKERQSHVNDSAFGVAQS